MRRVAGRRGRVRLLTWGRRGAGPEAWAAGKWKIAFAWPEDFTFRCRAGIGVFGGPNGEFAGA